MRDIPIPEVPLESDSPGITKPKPAHLYTQASHRSHEVMFMPRGRPFKCPYEGCDSTNTVGKGVRRTKTMGARKIRLCKGCGRKFTPKNQKAIQPDPVQ